MTTQVREEMGVAGETEFDLRNLLSHYPDSIIAAVAKTLANVNDEAGEAEKHVDVNCNIVYDLEEYEGEISTILRITRVQALACMKLLQTHPRFLFLEAVLEVHQEQQEDIN